MQLDFTGTGDGSIYQTSGTQNVFNVNSSKELDYIQKRLPTYLATVISSLEKQIGYESSQAVLIPYDIDAKILYNQVIKYERFIKDYGNYLYIIDGIYEAMNAVKPGSKTKFLNHINKKYKLICGELSKRNRNADKHNLICEHADAIIEKIIAELKIEYFDSANASNEIMGEDLHECLIIIVCNAFIDCKVLENPTA